MFSHVTAGTHDLDKAMAFFDAVLAPLGIARTHTYPEHGWAGYERAGEGAAFWIGKPFDGRPAARGNGWMAAFMAPTRAAVDAAHAKALELGGSDEGAPGIRAHYAPDYYGAYFRDPEGNKFCLVHRGG